MLGAYLHRDWPFKYETAEEALKDSGSEAWPERLTQAAAELHAHRPPRDDERRRAVSSTRCATTTPPGDGLTYIAWLHHVQAVLHDAANA
jgi:hypothetical protein